MTLTVERLISLAMLNPANAQITARLPSLGLNQCMLTAGCLLQAVWNYQAKLPTDWGIKDYDVFYFDEDLSWEAEDAVIRSVERLFQDLGVNIEVRNQARVHLWYEERFGRAFDPGGDRPLPDCRDVHRVGCRLGGSLCAVWAG